MVLGVLSVTTATKQHFAVVMLKSPLDVRLWMSRGKPTRRRRREDSGFIPSYEEVHPLDKYRGLDDFLPLQLESSIATLKAVALPRHLLDLSVVVFMVGIGLYELSGWKTTPSPRGTAYRNVFIVFIVTILAYLAYHALILVGAAHDSKKKDDEFGTGSLRGAWGESHQLSDLRDGLTKVQADLPREPRIANVLEELVKEMRESQSTRQEGLAQQLRAQAPRRVLV